MDSTPRLSVAASAAVLVFAALSTGAAQSPTEPTPLAAGSPAIERRLEAGGAHRYALRSTGNQLLELTVDQRGVDAVVSVFSPSGERLVAMDSPNGANGLETVRIVLTAPGTYGVEVRALEFMEGSFQPQSDSGCLAEAGGCEGKRIRPWRPTPSFRRHGLSHSSPQPPPRGGSSMFDGSPRAPLREVGSSLFDEPACGRHCR